MRKAFLYGTIALIALLLAGLAGMAGWILRTPGGARWLLDTAAGSAGVRLDIDTLEGRLIHGLRLKGVSVRTQEMRVRVGDLSFDWRPLRLLTGNLAFDRLDVTGIDILDQRPESKEPTDLSWPKVSGPLARMNGRVSSFTIRDLVYRRQDQPHLTLSGLKGSLLWRSGRAALTGLELTSPDGKITGDIGISFREPMLNLFARILPSTPRGGFKKLLLLCELSPAFGKEQAAGKVRAVALAETNRSFDLSAGLGFSRRQINVRDLVLTESGRKGRISGSGEISFASPQVSMGARIKAEGLDLSPEVPTLPPITGEVELTGSPDRYRGSYTLSAPAKGWRSASLAGTLSGSLEGLALTIEKGYWLGGAIGGSLRMGWNEGFILSGDLRGRGMDPARITPDWKGVVNLDLKGRLRSVEGEPLSAGVEGKLLSSRLRGRALEGELAARATEGAIILDRLFLLGNGFDIRASGDLRRRIGFSVLADDLGGLVPETSGKLSAKGELVLRDGRVGGSASGKAGGLKAASFKAGSASFELSVGTEKARPIRIRINSKELEYAGIRASQAGVDANGTLERHRISLDARFPGAELRAAMEGGYRASAWSGRITALSGRDRTGPWRLERPATLAVSPRDLEVSSLALSGGPGERLELDGEMNFEPVSGRITARWQRLNLARLSPWIGEGKVSGSGSGNLSLILPSGGTARITADAEISGTVTAGEYRVELRRGSLEAKTEGKDVRLTAVLDTARDGRLDVTLAFAAPTGLKPPERGDFQARLEGGDFRAIRPWLPAGLSLEGGLDARASGEWFQSGRFRLAGSASVGKGTLTHQREGGDLKAEFSTASLNLDWRDQAIGGSLSMDLAETGRARADFRLPVPAALPVSVNRDGPVSLDLEGKVRESGVLTAMFPGIIQESRGEMDVRARASGTWNKPDLTGRFLLDKAGAYLPRAGVTLNDVRVSVRLEGDSVVVDSFSARSGQGSITGTGSMRLREWRPAEYRGSVKGENFRLMYLPELQVTGSPSLEFSGTPDKITVRGDLRIPDLLVSESRTPTPVRPSSDVVVVDAPQKKEAAFPLALDVRVRVIFGDRVFVRAAGIDARLGGSVDLTMTNPNNIRGKGEVRVAKGSYKAYGVNLEITKGRLVYLGGPVSRPNLDILALRTIGEVKAGISLGGTLQTPAIRLYSEPAMSDADIMAYIVLGHPLSGDQGQVNAVMDAAGLLLSAGQAAVLKEQITGKFGIDTFGIQPDKGDVTKSIVTVGKYLTPKLFISYGRSLFSPTNYLKARYTFTERWEVETWTGTESGVDLYYKINFD